MSITAGVLFALCECLLLGWLLFRNPKFLEQVVFAGAEKADTETDEPTAWHTWRTEPAFRGAVVAACTLLAGISGYISAGYTSTIYEPLKLGAALLGVSAAMLVDFYIYIIPNKFLLCACGSRILIFAAELIGGRPDWKASMLNSLIGLAVTFVVLFLLTFATRQGLGMGDVKLMSTIGFLCGISAVVNTLVYALILCVICSVVLLAGKKKGLKDKIPFGPFIYAGYILTLCMGAF